MEKERIVTLSFVTLAICNFLGAMNFYLLTAIFTEYSLKTYGLGYSTAALSVSLYIAGALFARVALGKKMDDWGIKRSLVAGYAIIAATSCLYVFPLPFGVLVGARFIQGIGFGIASGSGAAGAALIIPKSRRAEGIGYFSMTQALATGIGPFVAIGLINITGDYRALFIATAAAAIVMTAAAPLIKLPPATASGNDCGPQAAGNEPRGISRFIHPNVLPFGIPQLMVYFGYAGIITYMTLYASEQGLTGAASYFFIVYAIGILVSRPPLGRLADRKGENSVVLITLPLFALGLATLGAAGALHSGALMLLAAAMAGVGLGSTQSVLQAVVPKVVAPNELGRGNSTFFMMMDVGSGIGPVLLGLVVPLTGYSTMYYLLGIWVLLGLGVYWMLHGRHNRGAGIR